jgi:hypothetical protein
MRRSPRVYEILGTSAETFSFTDQEHGRSAPSYLRKHCRGCGKTLPNRSRSWVCPRCYPEYRLEMRRRAEAARRNRLRGGVPRWWRR